MRPVRSFVAIALGTLALLAACGGRSIETSCANLFDREVAFFQRCGGSIDPAQKSAYVDACVQMATAPGTNDLASQLDACSLDSCDGKTCILRGTLPANAPCAVGSQCQSGFCKVSSSPTSELACGTCEVVGALGDDCSTTFRCQDGLYCDTTTFKCTPVVGQGQPCPNLEGCDVGLYCDPVANVCLTPPGKGQPCTSQCASPYLCLGSVCTDPEPVGGPCPVGDECSVNLVCDPQTQLCAPTPISQVGGPCQPAVVAVCASGLICVGAGTCIVPKQQGAACTVGNDECAQNLLCIDGTCQIPDYGTCK